MTINYIKWRMCSAQQKQVPRRMRTRCLHWQRRGHVTLRPRASRALRHVVRVAVGVQFDCRSPRSKLVERHGPSAVLIELLEQRRGILDLGAPRLKLGHGALELLLVDQHVAGGVNLVEHHRQLEEVVDVAQHQTELQKFNKVLGALVLQLAAQGPRLVERTLRDVAHSRRELVQLQHLEAAAVHLIVAQLPSLVLVELLEELDAALFCLGGLLTRNRLANALPRFLAVLGVLAVLIARQPLVARRALRPTSTHLVALLDSAYYRLLHNLRASTQTHNRKREVAPRPTAAQKTHSNKGTGAHTHTHTHNDSRR
ncbi:hypothetical protein ECC02_003257 [Trypanosoma cruzi]|uniref:Uncharacterized protein n=1 Tax=Trypanosoma cruzi TaxID=5693 RepID=A0A7J6YAE9_TRYCR|nr:hypothetical protein ECC02_003257 [Trypanosoma cruzi]